MQVSGLGPHTAPTGFAMEISVLCYGYYLGMASKLYLPAQKIWFRSGALIK